MILVSLSAACTIVPSAKISMYDSLINNGKSLMNKRKSTGQRTEPCGAPLRIFWNDDLIVLFAMHCSRPSR